MCYTHCQVRERLRAQHTSCDRFCAQTNTDRLLWWGMPSRAIHFNTLYTRTPSTLTTRLIRWPIIFLFLYYSLVFLLMSNSYDFDRTYGTNLCDIIFLHYRHKTVMANSTEQHCTSLLYYLPFHSSLGKTITKLSFPKDYLWQNIREKKILSHNYFWGNISLVSITY